MVEDFVDGWFDEMDVVGIVYMVWRWEVFEVEPAGKRITRRLD
jgi:hypothetical protein